jgi:hypothetical protein
MSDNREIVVGVWANGTAIDTAGDAPLRQLRIEVSMQDPENRREIVLNFSLDLDGRIGFTGQGPDVRTPL